MFADFKFLTPRYKCVRLTKCCHFPFKVGLNFRHRDNATKKGLLRIMITVARHSRTQPQKGLRTVESVDFCVFHSCPPFFTTSELVFCRNTTRNRAESIRKRVACAPRPPCTGPAAWKFSGRWPTRSTRRMACTLSGACAPRSPMNRSISSRMWSDNS